MLAETGGTGQETGDDDLASKPAAGAATAAGCPAIKKEKCLNIQHKDLVKRLSPLHGEHLIKK